MSPPKKKDILIFFLRIEPCLDDKALINERVNELVKDPDIKLRENDIPNWFENVQQCKYLEMIVKDRHFRRKKIDRSILAGIGEINE